MHPPALLLLVICHTIVTNLSPAEALPRPIQYEGRRQTHMISTKKGRRMETLMRLGPNKEGVINGWSPAGNLAPAGLKQENSSPPIYIQAHPQLNGNLGSSSEKPRRLRARDQYKPASYVAPHGKKRPPPGGLTQLSDEQKDAIATVS